MNDWVQLAGTFAIALGAYVGIRHQVQGNREDAAQKVQSASVGLWESYRQELEQTRDYLRQVEAELLRSRDDRRELAARVERLEQWISANTDTHPDTINGEP